MSDKFIASLVVLRVVGLHKILKLLIISEINRIPEFGLAMVQVVDAVEVEVFFVPPEHCFPTANIYVRIGHSRYFLFSEALTIRNVELKNITYLSKV